MSTAAASAVPATGPTRISSASWRNASTCSTAPVHGSVLMRTRDVPFFGISASASLAISTTLLMIDACSMWTCLASSARYVIGEIENARSNV